VELHGRIKDCKALTYRQDIRAKEIEQYRVRMLPTRQVFLYFYLLISIDICMSCLFLICYCINFLQKVPLQNLSFSFYSEISKSTYSDDHYIRRCMYVVLGCSILILPTCSSSSIPLWLSFQFRFRCGVCFSFEV